MLATVETLLDELSAKLPAPQRPGFLSQRLLRRGLEVARGGEPASMVEGDVSPSNRYRLFHEVIVGADLGRPESILDSR